MAITITATATGTTDSVFLPLGEWALTFRASLWGEVSLEVSYDNTQWYAVETVHGAVVASSNRLIEVAGGLYYRLNVSSYETDIVLSATSVGVFQIVHPEVDTDNLQNNFLTRYFIEYHRSKLFVGETVTLPISLLRADGSPAESLEDKDIELVIENSDLTDLVIIDRDEMAIAGNTITVRIGPPVTDEARTLYWSIRESDTHTVIAYASFEVVYVPIRDDWE